MFQIMRQVTVLHFILSFQCLSFHVALGWTNHWKLLHVPAHHVPRTITSSSRCSRCSRCSRRTTTITSSSSSSSRPSTTTILFSSQSPPNTNVSTNLQENNSDGWTVGNVKDDFHLLRMEVARLNAPSHLEQAERLHLLDELAKQRIELIPHCMKIMRSVFISMFFGILLLVGKRRRRNRRLGLLFLPITCATTSILANVQFWILTVSAPLSIYIPKCWSKYQQSRTTKHIEMTKEEKERIMWDPEYIDPRLDCTDYIFCLMEHWLSSVYSPILVGALYLLWQSLSSSTSLSWTRRIPFSKIVTAMTPRFQFHHVIVGLGLPIARIVTRLGTIAATHQYPQLLYQLRRSNQPRPKTFFQSFANRLLRMFFRTTPYAIGYELSQCFTFLGPLVVAARQAGHRGVDVGGVDVQRFMLWCTKTKPNALFGLVTLLVLMIPSIIHLIALKRIVQIQYFTDVSLNSDRDTFHKAINDQESYKWRYKLLWREPKRLTKVIESMKVDFLLFYFSDWGTEQENKNGFQVVGDNGFNLIGDDGEEGEPLILSRIQEDMERTPNKPNPDRTTWVPYALKRKAEIHQADYDSKTFEVSISRHWFHRFSRNEDLLTFPQLFHRFYVVVAFSRIHWE